MLLACTLTITNNKTQVRILNVWNTMSEIHDQPKNWLQPTNEDKMEIYLFIYGSFNDSVISAIHNVQWYDD